MGKLVLLGMAAVFGAALARELPGLKRYQKISGM